MNLESYLAEPLPFREKLELLLAEVDRPMIFDIGACEGEDSIRLSRAFPRATVHAFEPVPGNVARIRANFARHAPRLKDPHAIALSDYDGVGLLHLSSGHPESIRREPNWDFGNKSSSLLPPSSLMGEYHPWLRFESDITVRVEKLETFCRHERISRVDFMYLDVQGAELQVLNGAGAFLQSVRAVWMEVEAVELYVGQPLAPDLDKFMKHHGFVLLMDTVEAVSGDRLYGRCEALPTQDACLGE
jgi:FkbM family methyltransferase